MSEAEFRSKRRQKFMTEKYFHMNRHILAREKGLDAQAVADQVLPPSDVSYSDIPGSAFGYAMKLFRLHYTAGEPIETLKPLYADAMKWFGEWHVAYAVQIQALARESGDDLRTDGTPVRFDDLFHFQLALDAVSLGVLLGDGDAVRRTAGWVTRYRHTDMLFESIIEPFVADPDTEVAQFFHESPYGPLVDAIFTAETPEAASAYVKQYLDGWYKGFEGVPWHNGHLVQTDEYSNYEGYWAFEAAAVCVIHNIDDSSFRDHLVYPKDLADWARANHSVDKAKPAAGAQALRMRCEAGQACPAEGYWFTTAKQGSRQHFKAGVVMPEIKNSAWGSTIWYWDERQDG
jgi:hypothetical protein